MCSSRHWGSGPKQRKYMKYMYSSPRPMSRLVPSTPLLLYSLLLFSYTPYSLLLYSCSSYLLCICLCLVQILVAFKKASVFSIPIFVYNSSSKLSLFPYNSSLNLALSCARSGSLQLSSRYLAVSIALYLHILDWTYPSLYK